MFFIHSFLVFYFRQGLSMSVYPDIWTMGLSPHQPQVKKIQYVFFYSHNRDDGIGKPCKPVISPYLLTYIVFIIIYLIRSQITVKEVKIASI